MTDRVSAALSKDTAVQDPLIGRVIGGRFKITALIARGGMGKVYRAEQAPLGRTCAIKVLNPGYVGEHDPEFHKRFFLEASVASKLTHPNTVTIFDYGRTEDDIYYMAMEYLEGHTLHRAIREAGHLPEGRAIHIAGQICRALREAHACGVIHRDLKPANIFLVEHGDQADFVKVLDFGLVKNVADKGEDLTQTGMFMGSPKYMAPEQIRGDRVDARTDIYGLGVILYEMLTGKVPFDRATSVNILMAHLNEEAPPMRQSIPQVSVSRGMEETVAGCMAKDPEQRMRSMDDVLASLKRAGGVTASTISGLEATERERVSGGPFFGDSGTPAASLSLQPVERGTPKGVLVLTFLGALAGAGVLGYIAMKPVRSVSTSAQVTPSTPAAPPTGPTVASTAVPAGMHEALPVSVKVRISTEPDGATVKEDGVELCSGTPCDILYQGEDADPAREHKLTFARQGYRTEVRSLKAGDSRAHVKLTAVARPALPAPTKADVPAVPTGYKTDIPY